MTEKENIIEVDGPILPEDIRAKIDELTRQRDEYVRNANMQVVAFNAAIEALSSLINKNGADAPKDSNQ